jgi:hypothetical protein
LIVNINNTYLYPIIFFIPESQPESSGSVQSLLKSSVPFQVLRQAFESTSDPLVSAQCRSNHGLLLFLAAVFHLFDFALNILPLPPPLINHGLQGRRRHSIPRSWPKTDRKFRNFD